jgi:hypothetical protein
VANHCPCPGQRQPSSLKAWSSPWSGSGPAAQTGAPGAFEPTLSQLSGHAFAKTRSPSPLSSAEQSRAGAFDEAVARRSSIGSRRMSLPASWNRSNATQDPGFDRPPLASTDLSRFGVASPVSKPLGHANGTGHSAGDKTHKGFQRIKIGKRRSRVSAGIAFGREVSLRRHPGRSVEANAPARRAGDGHSDTSPMPRHRLRSGFMFATTRSGIGPDAEVVNKRVRPASIRSILSRWRCSKDSISDSFGPQQRQEDVTNAPFLSKP